MSAVQRLHDAQEAGHNPTADTIVWAALDELLAETVQLRERVRELEATQAAPATPASVFGRPRLVR